jgi:hypothetical protein
MHQSGHSAGSHQLARPSPWSTAACWSPYGCRREWGAMGEFPISSHFLPPRGAEYTWPNCCVKRIHSDFSKGFVSGDALIASGPNSGVSPLRTTPGLGLYPSDDWQYLVEKSPRRSGTCRRDRRMVTRSRSGRLRRPGDGTQRRKLVGDRNREGIATRHDPSFPLRSSRGRLSNPDFTTTGAAFSSVV